MINEEKQKALEAALGHIEKQYGKGSVMKLGDSSSNMVVEAVPTGSLGLDIALGVGGVPKGRIVEIYGPESSGKTTVAYTGSSACSASINPAIPPLFCTSATICSATVVLPLDSGP